MQVVLRRAFQQTADESLKEKNKAMQTTKPWNSDKRVRGIHKLPAVALIVQ